MRFTTAISVLSFTAVALAQNATITVGAALTAQGGPFQFTPSSVNATTGSVITFVFMGAPGNHSVTQSSFNSPCDPLAGGFDSGNIFIPASTSSGFPTWNLTIEETSTPIWFHCKQLVPGPHCTAGMVGAINPPESGNTFQAFQSNAEAFSGTPGQSVGALSGQGAAATAVPGPFQGGITGFGLPNSTASPSETTTSTTTSTTSGASVLGFSVITTLCSVVVGMMLT